MASMVFTVAKARAHLYRLIAEADAEAGRDVIIARGTTPAVWLVPVDKKGKRQFGSLRGIIGFNERFWEPLPEDELRRWNGG